ncbi:hypothetical protein POM88_019377 [Heracleum sosnowskyi]|uniref:Xylanase inhibitor C-terminal domain-containing protein n=1 Tax=Heracleum sosnowskyi TaxID=360622 RepID=A0AAD8IU32_9APIA|nr:hypothetical protein POM88_051902 [Heracleum sosnowskyi]KAK1391199.1 hypothetical protein POM88_019377 [Heracleum sosnowskyi]
MEWSLISFHPYARLTLGDKADVRGKTTPLRIDGSHYRISLESIYLGWKKLDIHPKLFAQKGIEGGTGVIIDSGSIKTYLRDEAYNILCLAVGDEMVARGFKQRTNTRNLCYYGIVEEVKRSGFPIPILQLD